MASPEHSRLEQLFTAALAKGSWAERSTYLDGACPDDRRLRQEVEGLLHAHDHVGTFLDSPPVQSDTTVELTAPIEITETKIGRYRVLQEIGEGGFGTVYLAEQEEPVRRLVALKIIKPGMDTRQVIARFDAERQALALMDHPNIARVLDAGATESGRPYFVMELVRGVTITEYCNKNRLPTPARLKLFLPVCHAVQHAHQKGIIHRDLKPSNVLVTLDENQPVPKVIDFGIAKATSRRLTEKTLFTGFREFLGTPEYMSPDQAETGGLDVDTRTDIYSLGVLLYELLTGTTPFDAQMLRASSYEDIRRTIREVEPPKPSARLQTLSATPEGTAIAAHRHVEPATLPRLVRGDLDWIVMKAMEKDRTRRYATAKDLADDIERHVRHEPVSAGPPGLSYKLSKFVRRHRLGVLAGTIVGVAVLLGLSLATIGLLQANRARAALEVERDVAEEARVAAVNARTGEREQRALAEGRAAEARQEALKSATVSNFLQDMLGSVDPSNALGRDVTVRFVLDEAARKIDEGALAEQPEVEASVRMTLGETYRALGLYDAAAVHVGQAAALRSRLLGDAHADTLRSSRVLAGLLREKGKFAEAEALLRQTAQTQRQVLGDEHPDTLSTMNELGLTLMGPGRFTEAETIHRQTLQTRRRVLGDEHVDTLESMGHLGATCRALGQSSEAEKLLRQALEASRRVLGDEHPRTTTAMNNLGLFLEDQGQYEQAEALYRRSYELDRRILGPDHPRLLSPINNLLRVLQKLGKTTEIKPILADRLAHLKRLAERREARPIDLYSYAWELMTCEATDLRDPRAALPAAAKAVQLDGGTDPNTLEALALAYRLNGNLPQAIETQRRAIAQAQLGGPYNPEELQTKLVDYLVENGDLVAAAGVSWEGVAARLGKSLITDSDSAAPLVVRSQALMAEGRYEEAAGLLRGALAMRQKALPQGHWLIADTISQLGSALAGGAIFAEAEPLLIDGYNGLEGNRAAPADRRKLAIERIVHLYESWGRPESAEEWRRRGQANGPAKGDR